MTGFTAFLRKEAFEIVRTWRVWVLPGILLFFAITGPLLAKVTPALLASLLPAEGSGLRIEVPDPTYLDAYLQWTKNLAQIVLFAVIIAFGGVVSAEKRSGTAVLVLTKPVSRAAFVVAKAVASAALVVVAAAVGAALTWLVTRAVFGTAPAAPLAGATAVWLALAVLIVAVMVLLSAAFDSQAAAAGLGLAAYLVLSLATLWRPAVEYGPAGLVSAPDRIVAGEAGALGWPVVSALGLAAALVAAAVLVLRRREV